MMLMELLATELDREAERSKRALENMPEGKSDWKPHDKSMAFGYLAELVATIPTWIEMEISRDELDLNPPGGSQMKREPLTTQADYLRKHGEAVAAARAALLNTSEAHLQTPWRLLVAGRVVQEMSRYDMIRDTLNHLAHHRGQMTVYLRLMGAKVPALYGPSADDRRFS